MYCLAIISEIGARPHMEDTYCFLDIDENSQHLFGGVYDGHGGTAAAQYAKENLHQIFFKALKETKKPEPAFKIAYEETSANLANQESGTTAVNFYLKNKTLFYANAGDAKLIVISDSKVKQLSEDHRLTNPKERKRIVSQGSIIMEPYAMKGFLGLMPTRTIGDEYFKDIGIIATPAVGRYKLQAKDKWILAGTDGLFDYITNREIAQLLVKFKDVEKAAQTLKEEVLTNRGGSDNLTFILIRESAKRRLTTRKNAEISASQRFV